MKVKIKDVGNYNLINHCEYKIYEAIKDIYSELIKVNVGIENSINGWLAFEKECLEIIEDAVKMKVRLLNIDRYATIQEVGDIVEAEKSVSGGYLCKVKCEYGIDELWFPSGIVEVIEDEPQKDEHYNNENGSLYLFAQQHNLNAWEFDILKRIVRCRKKGQFKEDLEKTKRVIDLYLKEFEA